MKTHSERRKEYNSDKKSVQLLNTTHEKLKHHCKKNNIKLKDFLNELILFSIKNQTQVEVIKIFQNFFETEVINIEIINNEYLVVNFINDQDLIYQIKNNKSYVYRKYNLLEDDSNKIKSIFRDLKITKILQ